MAVVNTLSTAANPIGHPQTAANITGQRMKTVRSLISIANGDSAGSTYVLAQIPDSAMVKSIILEGATITGLTGESVGLFDNNGVVKNATAYANANLNFTSSTGLPIGDTGNPVWRAGSRAIANALQEVYLDAGDVIGPVPAVGASLKAAKYQVGLTLNHAATAAGTLMATVEYMCAE